MTSRLSLLLASTTLSVVLGLPALAAMPMQSGPASACGGSCALSIDADTSAAPVIRVSSDDDDDEGGWLSKWGDDDDDDDEEDDCDDDDDDCGGKAGRGNPAPAGTVAPPANGLFGTGAPPVAVTN